MIRKKEMTGLSVKIKSNFVRKEIVGCLLLLPALASIIVFKYLPMLTGFFLSFFKLNIADMPGQFVGFDNFVRALTDKNFLVAFLHNFKGFMYGLCMHFWVPIFFAVLINEVRKGKTFFRLIYFIPGCAPAIAMTVLWKYFWQPDYGLANYLVGLIGIEPQLWLNDVDLVYFCMSFPGLVMAGGMNLVIYLAALQDIPVELYESTLIDGAGFWTRFFKITLPHIKGIVVLMLTLSIINSLNAMENIMLLTGGGPAGSTETLMLYAYKQATDTMDYSYAMTMSTIVFVITMTLSVFFNKITANKD